ncbi:MAG: CoA transferase [Gammaproteobacteria bacterium]|nr:CoA transferase [Gammaproteobacteria bacterium]
MIQQHLLTGIRVLDFTRVLAGPTCTRMFAECGAEVIKVESGPDGDMVRKISKFRGNDRSLYLIQQNLNKKSVCLDFRKPESIALLRELVAQCDVVVENFRPGVMAKLGLAYADCKAIKEDIVYCSISALGQSGELAAKPGYDFIAQAYSGVTSLIGERDEPPYLPLLGLGDVSTGVHAAFGIAAALLHRARTGLGQYLDIALLDCYYHYHEAAVHTCSGTRGAVKPTRSGRHFSYVCPAGVFRANGGSIVLIGFLHHWADLCAALGRPELVADPGWATDQVRLAKVDEVVGMIEAWLMKFPDIDSAIATLDGHGVPCAPILSVEQTLTHPHFIERGTVRTVHDRLAGDIQIPGMPIKGSTYPANNDYVAPLLGEHNAEVLSGLLGKSEGEIAALTASGVLMSAAS